MKLGILVLLTLFVCSLAANATTHTIMFGGSVGFAYSPNTLEVAVGDTIEWQGDFGFHPLASDNIPATATAFSNTDGTSYRYAVTVPGTYGYHCTMHGAPGQGMFGTFTAVAASVKGSSLASNSMLGSFPNPASGTVNFSFTLTEAAHVQLKIYTTDGKELASPVTGRWSAGTYSVPFDTKPLSAGAYFYKLVVNDDIVTKELIVTK